MLRLLVTNSAEPDWKGLSSRLLLESSDGGSGGAWVGAIEAACDWVGLKAPHILKLSVASRHCSTM